MRTGIDERWAKSWKRMRRNSDAWVVAYAERQRQHLQYYIDHGARYPTPELKTIVFPPVTPPWGTWEDANVLGNLRICAALYQWQWERAAIEEGRLDIEAIASMFAAAELSELDALRDHALFPQRHPGRSLQTMDVHGFLYSALGLVAGPREASLELARLQLVALDRDMYYRRDFRPTAVFAVRMFADFLGRPPVQLRGDPQPLLKRELAADPIYDALFAVWRAPDPGALVEPALAALDIHTYLASPGKDYERREFVGTWMRIPLAVLLTLRMRELLGLPNPELHHPLMDTAIGRSLGETAGAPDPLIQAVRTRMIQDGFDEQDIRRMYLE
jgi:hypothetical protein